MQNLSWKGIDGSLGVVNQTFPSPYSPTKTHAPVHTDSPNHLSPLAGAVLRILLLGWRLAYLAKFIFMKGCLELVLR